MATKKRRKYKRHTLRARKTITREEYERRIRARNSTSLGFLSVVAFGNKALREAFRVWWHPHDMGADFDRLTGAPVWSVMGRVHERVERQTVIDGGAIELRRLNPPHPNVAKFMRGIKVHRGFKPARRPPAPSAARATVKVRIVLTYPLVEPRSKVVIIDRRYPGEIFGLAHDFYRELYAEDEKLGGEAGPMNGGRGPLLNRGKGPVITSHDIGDLCFGRCWYIALPKRGALIGKTAAWGPDLTLAARDTDGAEGVFLFGIDS